MRVGMTAGVVLAVLAVVFLGAAAQALSGFGFNLLITPLLAALVGPKPAVVGASLLALVLSAFQAVKWRPLADIPTARVVLVGSLVGMPIGLLVLRELPADALTISIWRTGDGEAVFTTARTDGTVVIDQGLCRFS